MRSTPTPVTVWVDPVCPFAWLTYRWLDEVERLGRAEVNVRIMSLSVLNDGREGLSDFYRDLVDRAWPAVRVCVAAQDAHGAGVVRPLYEAIARRIHLEDRRQDRTLLAEALDECGLPATLVDSGWTTALDHILGAGNADALSLVGDDVGTPVLHLVGPHGPTGWFGPVLTAAPTGDGAVRLFDAVVTAAACEDFVELKRARTRPLELR